MQANVRAKVDYKPVGVTDVTLGAINLERRPAKIRDRGLRFRKLTIEPWHRALDSHDDRPALIYRAGRNRQICEQLLGADLNKAGEIRPEVAVIANADAIGDHPQRSAR